VTASRSLRIAVVAPPYYEVPPPLYGGVERVCHVLVEGLLDRGHEVTLIAAGGNHTRARFVATFPRPQPEGTDADAEIEIAHAARAAAALEDLDVDLVHDHTRAGPLTALSRPAPTLATAHAAVVGPDARVEPLEALGRWVGLIALSEAQRRAAPHLNWVATVHNGIRVEEHPFRADKEEYVLFLSRLSPNKGVHIAIDAALAAGRRLVIAGTWTTPSERTYYEEQVRPRLGGHAEWVGAVPNEERNALLAGAACLLLPVRWNEPFGLVVVEAMACGTPVVGLRAGALPELVVDGLTGVICDSPPELPRAMDEAARLCPSDCREHVARSFSAERMAAAYESVYRARLDDR